MFKRFFPRTQQEAAAFALTLIIGQISIATFGWPWHVAQTLFALVWR